MLRAAFLILAPFFNSMLPGLPPKKTLKKIEVFFYFNALPSIAAKCINVGAVEDELAVFFQNDFFASGEPDFTLQGKSRPILHHHVPSGVF